MTLPFAVGIALGVLVCTFARGVGFDRDRSFYPTVLIVVAWYYVLFAVMGGSSRALVVEVAAMTLFGLCAVAGFKYQFWLVVAGLAAHGVFDAVHGSLVSNPGVPEWWPAFCGSIDVTMGAFVAVFPRRYGRTI